MTNEHEIYESMILRLPDGDLTDDEAEALRAHLSSCADCRRLFTALREATAALDSDENLEPPAALREGVMARVRDENDNNTVVISRAGAKAAPDKRTADRRRRRRKGLGAVLGIAAAFMLIVGGGIFAARSLLGSMGSSAAPLQQSAALDAGPQPAPEAAPAAAENAVTFEAAVGDDEYSLAAAEEAADMAPVYTWENPALVPEGSEAAFDALLGTDRQASDISDAELTLLAAVEYRGVIYEFFTDAEENTLYWRDAAEGAVLNLSPGNASELLDIIG